MISIVADHREARSNIAMLLRDKPNISVQERELSCGDYLIDESFIVERKSANDFVVSIMDRRLFEQSAKMKADYENVAFIIEGDLRKVRSKISQDAVRGALSYLVAIQGASVVYTDSPAESAALLADMARHRQEGLGYQISLRAGKPKDLRTQAQFIVEGFPGIGPGTAVALLNHFGAVRAILEASESELRLVPGIGPKAAKQILEILTVDYRTTLR